MFVTMKPLVLLGLTCFIIGSEQKSTPEDSSYVAAVVEYEVIADTDTNVANYVRLIEDAATQNADIVVFPEMTLTRGSDRSVPVPIYGLLKEYPIPATHADIYNDILVAISSAARENAIYVVINIQEIMNCEDAPGEFCPEKKAYYFNTNVVFDRDGAIIDRYRKINLFGEYSRTPALEADLGQFTTDFGVQFGHFICFDLMFQVPAIQTPQKLNVTDIIFSTMWFSEMPYLTAVEIQQGYAQQMNVNFLAAGANNVKFGSTGSGIFSGKAGALISLMSGVPTTRLMVARVPKVPGQVTWSYPGPIYDDPSQRDDLLLKVDPSLTAHTSRLLVPGYQKFILTSDDTMCIFKINMTQTENTILKYRAIIHDGFNVYANTRHIRVASCLIVSCSSDDSKDCPYRFSKEEEKIEFQELNIKMSSHPLKYNSTLKCDDVEYFGLSLRNNKFPLNPANYTFSKHEIQHENINFSFKLNAPQNDLIAFSIWSRIYGEDKIIPREVTTNDVNNYKNIENLYKYRAGAFGGVRTFDGIASGGAKNCGVFSCTGDSIDTCAKRFEIYTPNSLATFAELSIDALLNTPQRNDEIQADNMAYFPISLQPTILPLEVKDYSLDIVSLFGIVDLYKYKLLKKDAELYSFGIFGRVFEKDGQEPSPPWVDGEPSSTPPPEADVTDAPGTASTSHITVYMLFMALSMITFM